MSGHLGLNNLRVAHVAKEDLITLSGRCFGDKKMELQETYDALQRQQENVKTARTFGLLGPFPPEDSYREGIARLQSQQTDYTERQIMLMGEFCVGTTGYGSRELAADILQLGQAGIFVPEVYSESAELQRWKTSPEFPETDSREVIDEFVRAHWQE